MPKMVVDGAKLRCSQGTLPSILVIPGDDAPLVSDDKPVATVKDRVSKRNLITFGMCRSQANPQVASATAAALGVLTPQPCIPSTNQDWTPGAPMAVSDDTNVLTSDSTCKCDFNGEIDILDPNNDVEIEL
jgi:hypothetical protein